MKCIRHNESRVRSETGMMIAIERVSGRNASLCISCKCRCGWGGWSWVESRRRGEAGQCCWSRKDEAEPGDTGGWGGKQMSDLRWSYTPHWGPGLFEISAVPSADL